MLSFVAESSRRAGLIDCSSTLFELALAFPANRYMMIGGDCLTPVLSLAPETTDLEGFCPRREDLGGWEC